MVAKNEYPKAANAVVYGGILLYIAGMCLMISFCSPYWIQSFEETFSDFKHMGLWQYCFHDFRYPYYQFNHLFDGCHYIFSQEYYVIREWLLPGWLIFVQAFVTMAFILSFAAQGLIALIITRYPLEFVLRYEWLLIGMSFIGSIVSAVFLSLAVIIFGFSCYRRDWIMYPNFNYVSWSFYFAVISMFFHYFSAFALYNETKRSYERRRESKNLVMQMHPEPQSRASYY
ncbi:uncharacterized protein LOC123293133 [Chrysoperla carnea]|uniref:uncharacterized protein LOC123293133 n=1 Tax=Chrysoperla carnea TaxID=189513 RepID=UPI001D08CE5B|nr:uncharacterized protein LOC123293133 [Chrysoperla carnea]